MNPSDARDEEIRRRDLAQQHQGDIQEGSGRSVQPRAMDQMVSVRLDPSLVATLRRIASERGVSLSAVIRDATRFYAKASSNHTELHWEIVGAIGTVETGHEMSIPSVGILRPV